MKRRVLITLLAMSLTAAMITGCGNKPSNQETAGNRTSNQEIVPPSDMSSLSRLCLISEDNGDNHRKAVTYCSLAYEIRVLDDNKDSTRIVWKMSDDGEYYRYGPSVNLEDFDSTVWKVSEDGLLYYYDPISESEVGTAENPFKVVNIYKNGISTYTNIGIIEDLHNLPNGRYIFKEIEIEEGYVIKTNDFRHGD